MISAGELLVFVAKADLVAAELGIAEPQARAYFMRRLIEKLGEQFCNECWGEPRGCQCWNDE